ncbi:hypothetical protein M513_01344 [Trichuris suis]|uniref:SCP domain-containing protein n=1 Tax=Trichuris suis TaxID=68888 RepID=A0A085MKC8_9BILA|nr:hypothetical protein M513_01344 [Trichuris suis]
MIHSSNAQLTPTNVLEEVWVVYANAYDYLTNTCNLTFTTTCNHTLQFLWFEGGQIGCARSECAANTTQYLTVCAYPHRALLSMRPHTIAPPLAVCTLCSTKFPSCRDDLCCNRERKTMLEFAVLLRIVQQLKMPNDNRSYETEEQFSCSDTMKLRHVWVIIFLGVAPTTTTTTTNTTTTTTQPTTAGPKECGCAPTSQLVDFIRLYDKKENRNIFEIDQQAVSALVAKGVSNLGSAGRVAKILNSTACPFMQPIVVMRSDRNKKNIYAIDSTAITAARYHGFVQRGTIGYAVPGKDMCQASTAIYTFRHPCLGFVQLSNVTDVKTLLADRVWRGYQWRGAEFYIW